MIKFKGHKEAYKVSGIIEDTMYSHSSMVMMNHSDFKTLNKIILHSIQLKNSVKR